MFSHKVFGEMPLVPLDALYNMSSTISAAFHVMWLGEILIRIAFNIFILRFPKVIRYLFLTFIIL